MLKLPSDDALIMHAVLDAAYERRDEERKQFADYLAGEIAGRVVPPLAKTQWASIAALARALSRQ
jgi:hypothetical protein